MFKKLAILTALTVLSLGGVSGVNAAPPGFSSWDDVLAQARGQTVYWNMWGGSAGINRYVDETLGGALADEFGVTLNRIPIKDTIDAVNQVLSEAEAGVADDGGSIDAIWINGENFATLMQANLLYGPFAAGIPNNKFVDWDNPVVSIDFGMDVAGYETPWSGGIFSWVYDQARMSADELPRSYADLETWIIANPGRFTYIAPGPGAFHGTRIIKQLFVEMCGGWDAFKDFDQATWDDCAPKVWDRLNAWKPYLWRQGETYPADINEYDQLFANNEIDFTLSLRATGAASGIAEGKYPETAKAFMFSDNMMGDTSYIAIPLNAPNKAAALVLANLILRPDMQAAQLDPANGYGAGPGIDVRKITDPAQRKLIDDTFASIKGAADPEEFAAKIPMIAGAYHALVEADWETYVLRK
jgi:putative spermidine/putrescine transport system substrate-binding protein